MLAAVSGTAAEASASPGKRIVTRSPLKRLNSRRYPGIFDATKTESNSEVKGGPGDSRPVGGRRADRHPRSHDRHLDARRTRPAEAVRGRARPDRDGDARSKRAGPTDAWQRGGAGDPAGPVPGSDRASDCVDAKPAEEASVTENGRVVGIVTEVDLLCAG